MKDDLFTRFSCIMTLNEYELVRKSSPYSRKNVRIKGISLLIPMLVWLSMVGLITYRETQNILLAIAGGLAGMTLIALVDMQIVAAQEKNWISGIIRFILACLFAYASALLIDDAFFDKDIRRKIETNKKIALTESDSLVNDRWQKDNAILLSEIDKTELTLSRARQKHIDEMQGKNGRPSGAGRVARELQKYVQAEELKLGGLLAQRFQKEELRDQEMIEARIKVQEQYADPGPLLRLSTLHQLVWEDGTVRKTYWAFLAICFLMELFVLSNKPQKHSDLETGMELSRDFMMKKHEIMRGDMEKALAHPNLIQKTDDLLRRG